MAINDPKQLSDGSPIPELDFEHRARAVELTDEDHEDLAHYAAGLEQTMLCVSAFLGGYDDVAEIAAKSLRGAVGGR